MNTRSMARALAWVGIGLGLAEVLAPRVTAEAVGLRGREGLIRLFGLREIGSGLLLLAAHAPERLLWVRIAGDLLDGAVLGEGLRPSAAHRDRTLLATLVVAPVVLADLAVWVAALSGRPGRPG